MDRHVYSKNGVKIRLTSERWGHITEEHCELAGFMFDVLETVESPTKIFEGNYGALLAYRALTPGKAMVVIYRETSKHDGFIITAFLTKKLEKINRRKVLWQT